MTDWKSSLRSDPIPWLLETASPPIRYRVLTELLGLGRDDLDVQKARADVLAYGPAAQLKRTQRSEGLPSFAGKINYTDVRIGSRSPVLL